MSVNAVAEQFRKDFKDLGFITELIIGNVVVGSCTWSSAYKIALVIRARFTQLQNNTEGMGI